MTKDQREIERKLRILRYAEKIGNVAKACRYFGIGRSSFYRWKQAYAERGEQGVEIIQDVLSRDHVHMFVSVPPKLALSDLMRLMKGRSSHKVQREFPHLKKRYWGCGFWGRGIFQLRTAPSQKTSYFSTWKSTSNILPSPVGSA